MRCSGKNCPIKLYCERFHVSGKADAPYFYKNKLLHCASYTIKRPNSITTDEIGELIIAQLQKSGDVAGGSGHMSYVTTELLLSKQLSSHEYFVLFEINIQSEFNDYFYIKAFDVILDSQNRITAFNPLATENLNTPDNPDWEFPID